MSNATTTSNFLSVEKLIEQILRNQTTLNVGHNNNNNNNNNNSLGRRTPEALVLLSCNHSARCNGTKSVLNMINYYPPSYMSEEVRIHGGFILDILLVLYLFLLLWVVIDSYFLNSIQHISAVFRISPNVLGATLVAVGTSMPELFMCIINLIVDDSNIGTSVLLGSSIFNVLAIPGVCGVTIWCLGKVHRGSRLSVNFWPIARDVVFYTITIIIFLLSIKDNSIDCLEAVTFIGIYFIYICSLNVWSNFTIVNDAIFLSKSEQSHENYFLGYQRRMHRTHSMTVEPQEYQDTPKSVQSMREANYIINNRSVVVLALPVLVSLPYPRTSNRLFVLTFFMSVLWMAGLNYLIIWVWTMLAKLLLTTATDVHAAHWTMIMIETCCKNMPKLIASLLILWKFGLADMALCNVFGSNIFEILICLGVPWFFKILSLILVDGPELSKLGKYVIPLEDHILYFATISLLLSLLFFIFIFCLTHWRLTMKASVGLVLAYILFIISAFLFRI